MDNSTLIAAVSIITAGLTIAIGCMIPALGQGPDAEQTITRTLFVGLAMLESLAIYCFVVAMILIFANPFWNHFIK
jgi:F-type H+-transporting ATPase subunit c